MANGQHVPDDPVVTEPLPAVTASAAEPVRALVRGGARANRDEKPTTIVEAIVDVMKRRQEPMTAGEVYAAIIEGGLYDFKADQPEHVVRSQIRRHCLGLDFPSASARKFFGTRSDGRYFLLGRPKTLVRGEKRGRSISPADDLSAAVRLAYDRYLSSFKARALAAINKLSPRDFELFCRNLLSAYGFRDVMVTKVGKDGGIDGHGRLKVGFAFFTVAFQCKKWSHANVGRPEINQFRGDIQGQYEQGLFFTTAKFTADAHSAAFKPGAVTIVLIDGPTIVDIMIDKAFGVEKESLEMYGLAIDNAITEPT